MEAVRRILHYLWHLQWTERKQHICTFCNPENFKNIVYEDNEVIAAENRTRAGRFHWLIMPRLHVVRDIEALDQSHTNLLYHMDEVKKQLLKDNNCADNPNVRVHAGYHRGRRSFSLFGKHMFFIPDIVSVHHLHLHVIIDPDFWLRLFKYPSWLGLMWKSDRDVLARILREKERCGIKRPRHAITV